MKLPKFVIIESGIDLPGAGYILDTSEHPYHFARILKYGNMSDIAINHKPAFIQTQIDGYAIIIALAGSVKGPVYMSAYGPDKLQRLINDMADWFAKNQIYKQVSKYKKYRL